MKRFEELITILFILIPVLNLLITALAKKAKKKAAQQSAAQEFVEEEEVVKTFPPAQTTTTPATKTAGGRLQHTRLRHESLMPERKRISITEEKEEVITRKGMEKANEKPRSDAGELLGSPEQLRRAVIISEILNRKQV